MTAAGVALARDSARLGFDWLLPAAIGLAAVFLYINGAVFSPFSALHIDFSVNYTAAHAIRDRQDPYGDSTLLARAEALHSPTNLIYRSLFTSYIQPPTSALSTVPLTVLSWRKASRAYLLLNNVLLAAAVALTLYTVRPTLPRRWALAGAAVMVMGYSQIYDSFALGQVDASVVFLLALGLWGYATGRPAVTGVAIAVGTAIKLVPGLLLLYFLWKREYRVVAWGAGVGLALLVVSLPIVGIDTYHTYLTHTLPALSKGSGYYANVSVPGAIVRGFVSRIGDLPVRESLAETPSVTAMRVWTVLAQLAIVIAVASAVGRSTRRSVALSSAAFEQTFVLEYYLVVAAGLLVSAIAWESYLVWLLPLFLAVFLAPARVLPASRGVQVVALLALALGYLALNLPGDLYPFDVNSFFYHPAWVPGVWVEDRLQLYHHHLSAVPYIRLAALSLVAATLGAVLVWQRLKFGRAPEGGALT